VSEQRFERSGEAEGKGLKKRERGRGAYWLFLLPFVGTFFPWIYNTDSPELFGIPFFYWYQMAWVPLTVILTILVYRATTSRER
jgi:Protein of unknown function (DUF3311)